MYPWWVWLIPVGLLIWTIMALRIAFAAKKRADRIEEETFEKRDN